MKTQQINLKVGVRIPVQYGHVHYEITEFVDLEPDEDRDQALKDKRLDLTKHVYNHALQMRNNLDSEIDSHNESKNKP